METSPAPLGLLIAGEWVPTPETIPVVNSFAGEQVGAVSRGTPADIDAAVGAAAAALKTSFPMHARYDVLMRAADLLVEHQAAYALDIAREGSKTIREARREPVRAAGILRLAAEEGRRLHGETLPFDIRPGSENRTGYYYRVPVGVVAAIMPFNDPLAVMTHKIGPAIAGGNAIVLKPDSRAPLAVLRLARHLMEAGLPKGRLNVVTGGADVGEALVVDPRVQMVSFTGGAATGDRIARMAGVKKLSLELGANSPVLVLADADLDRAVAAVAEGAFAQAGQNCLGVQRVFVHRSRLEAFSERLAARAAALRVGSSLDDATDVCPMITHDQADRVAEWIEEARAGGARVLAGGRREGAMIWPTVLGDVPEGCRLDEDEVYGPVVGLYSFDTLDEAIEQANRTVFGLHAAVFTESLQDAFEAIHRLEAAGVIVNDSTDYRLDVMPFGGTKKSGIGREGVRFALQEMTDTKVVCINLRRPEG